jgi:hypothetical protein
MNRAQRRKHIRTQPNPRHSTTRPTASSILRGRTLAPEYQPSSIPVIDADLGIADQPKEE